MSESITIKKLRHERVETLEEFGRLIGLSKSRTCEIEKTNRASLHVALKIEALSGGRIRAADINDEVALVQSQPAA